MIRQCLSNKNESTTVAKKPKFWELNKALETVAATAAIVSCGGVVRSRRT